MDHVDMDSFYDQKKARLHELKIERELQQRKERQDAWAARLVPLDDCMKPCCKNNCLNGGIPRQLLEFTRKVWNRHFNYCEGHQKQSLLFFHGRNFLNLTTSATENDQSLNCLMRPVHQAFPSLRACTPYAGEVWQNSWEFPTASCKRCNKHPKQGIGHTQEDPAD